LRSLTLQLTADGLDIDQVARLRERFGKMRGDRLAIADAFVGLLNKIEQPVQESMDGFRVTQDGL
jgi:hypothetical protein